MKTHSVKFNFIMNIILTVSGVIFPLITFPYISRVLLVEGSGKIAFSTSVVTYFTMFATLGLPTYGVRACAQVRDDRERLSQTVQELLIISGITTSITYVVFFASLFLIPTFSERKKLLMIMGISIGLTTIGVQWLYNALEQYSYITLCALVFKLIGMILMFLFVKDIDDYLIYGVIYVIGSAGSYILNFVRLKKFVSLKKQRRYELRKHLKATFTFFLLSAASSVYLNLDVVMLGFMQGETQVGYYNAGIKVKSVLVACVTSLGAVLLPRLSYYIQNRNQEEFRRMISKAFNFVFVVATSVCIYFTLFARESILLLSGSEAFLPAVKPMIILLPTVLLIGLSNVTGIQVLTPLGEERKVVISVAVGAIFDFLFNLILIPQYGADGAAFSTLMAEILVLFVQCVYLRKQIIGMVRDVPFGKIILGLILAVMSVLMIEEVLELGIFIKLCVTSITFFSVYGIALVLLKEPFVYSILEYGVQILRKKK